MFEVYSGLVWGLFMVGLEFIYLSLYIYIYIHMMFLRVCLGLRGSKQEKAEKQRSNEAETQRSSKAEKQQNREAGK